MTVVIGIDPSLCNTGIAVMELQPNGERLLGVSVVRTAPSAKRRKVLAAEDGARRVAEIVAALDAAIATARPVALAVEAPAGSKGAQAARALALAFGAVIAVAKVRGLPLVQVQPGDVKRAMCRQKGASKDDVILAVEARYPEVEWPTPQGVWEHAADAVGAIVAALDSETLRLARTLARPAEIARDAAREPAPAVCARPGATEVVGPVKEPLGVGQSGLIDNQRIQNA
jgi:Holliday junction resolvasome RuvABC endonuclease subunit